MKRQQGFGLIEVLLAFIVVAVSAGALLQLNKSYLEYGRDGRNREVALRLAESRLDELRGFREQAEYDAIAAGSSTTTLDGIDYNIQVGVVDWGWDGTQWVILPATGVASAKKEVAVTVNWNDADSPQSFTLASVVTPERSFTEGPFGSGGGNAGLGLGGPDVDHKAKDVLLFDLGNGYTQETSLPTREDNKVSFYTTTYKRKDAEDKTDDEGKKEQVQEFETVECNCSLSAGESEEKLPGKREMLGELSYWKKGTTVSKSTGTDSGSDSKKLCERCCENHFDYDPADSSEDEFSNWYDVAKWKSSAGKSAEAPHKHYSSVLGVFTSASSLKPDYLESCRFARIDGKFEVVNDWNLVALNIIKEEFLSDKDYLAAYKGYVEQVVIEHLKKQVLDGDKYALPYTQPSQTLEEYLEQNPPDDSWKDKFYFKHDGKKKVAARGIYIDMLSEDYRQALSDKVTGGIIETTKVGDLISEGFIQYAPFTEVRLNELMEWDIKDKDELTAINDKVKFYDQDKWEVVVDYTKDESAQEPVKATVGSMRRSNSGITGNPISPDELSDQKDGFIYIDRTR